MASADNSQPVSDAIRAPLGFLQIAAATLASAVGLVNATNTLPIPPKARRIVMQADTVAAAAIRWRDDGTAPTASVGMYLAAGSSVEYTGDIAAIQFIAVSGSPILNVSYYS